jgi:hypothetical protein
MKTITLKTVKMQVGDQVGELNYKTQIASILGSPSNPQAGADYEEVRRSIRLLDLLDKVGDGDPKPPCLVLEDADFEYLKARIKGARYLVINRQVLDFIEDVTAPK